MDLPFLKLDSLEQPTATPESDTTVPANTADAPADGFKNMLSNLSAAEPVKPNQVDLKLTLDLKPELKAELKPEIKLETDETAATPTTTTDAQPNPTLDLNSLVAQLNLAQAIAQQQPQSQPLPTPTVADTKPVVDQPLPELTNTNVQNQQQLTNPNQLFNKNFSDQIKQTKLVNPVLQQQINQNTANMLKNANPQQTTDTQSTPDDESTDTTDLQNAVINPVDLKQMAVQPSADVKMDLSHLPQADSTNNAISAPVQNQVIATPIMTKPETHSKSITATTTTDVVAPSTNNDQNKYLSVFSQLSQLVNAQTQNLQPSNNLTATTHHVNFADALNSAAATDNKLEIELMPKSSVFSPSQVAAEVYNAKIKIYPPELGHITAELSIDKNSAQLHILTQNHQVKEIVEANLPQLKERLQSADINLTNVQVQTSMSGSREQFNQQNSTSQEHLKQTEGSSMFGESAEAVVAEPQVKKNIDSLVDLYA